MARLPFDRAGTPVLWLIVRKGEFSEARCNGAIWTTRSKTLATELRIAAHLAFLGALIVGGDRATDGDRRLNFANWNI
ncbi:unnamed protein product [Lasius platythorax]|uniref:Uncharacterized protein n=1 Tax=Lasius platythorax TaxID=488582 RepID=A0AAV2P3L7_9HYME